MDSQLLQSAIVGAIILAAVLYLGLRWRRGLAAARGEEADGCGDGCGCGPK